MTDRFVSYLAASRAALATLDLAAVGVAAQLIDDARRAGSTVFSCGNGGSATTASHFTADYLKNAIDPAHPRPRALCLCDSTAAISAIANDLAFDRVFAEPLASLGRPGDLLLALSASGNSPNILAAVTQAHTLGMTVIGLTGFSGGSLRTTADCGIHIPVDSYEVTEDLHLTVCHLLVTALKPARSAPAIRVAEPAV